jgi:hypothetical protein
MPLAVAHLNSLQRKEEPQVPVTLWSLHNGLACLECLTKMQTAYNLIAAGATLQQAESVSASPAIGLSAAMRNC